MNICNSDNTNGNVAHASIATLGENPVTNNRHACGQGGVKVVNTEDAFTDADHGFSRWWLICEETVGSKAISMAFGKLTPGQRGNLHVHDVDTAIFSLTGRVVAVFETNGGMHEVESPAHTALFIPAGTPHAPINPSATEEYHYVVFRPGQRD